MSARPATARSGGMVGGWIPATEEGRLDAVKLLCFVRAKAITKYVRIVDFMRQYDKFK